MPRIEILRLLLCLIFSSTLVFIYQITRINEIKDQDLSIDNYTRCLLTVHQALESLSIPWFITFGSALMYWRSKNFISNDMDIGIFYEDLKIKNLTDQKFVSNMIKNYNFTFRHRYGRIDHGQEWAFLCPKSHIPIDVFIFYPLNELNKSSDYWTATYNGLCNKMIYKKCRWKFTKFNLTLFDMYEKYFNIVSIDFVKERYGKDYLIRKKYDYFQSLIILPNLIKEYSMNNTKNRF